MAHRLWLKQALKVNLRGYNVMKVRSDPERALGLVPNSEIELWDQIKACLYLAPNVKNCLQGLVPSVKKV